MKEKSANDERVRVGKPPPPPCVQQRSKEDGKMKRARDSGFDGCIGGKRKTPRLIWLTR